MKKVDFANDRIRTTILQTAVPMLFAQIFTLLYNIIDRIYIGRIPGEGTEALGAVGLCFPVIILITGFSNMYGLGGAPLFSMSLGQKDRQKAGRILNTAFRLILITAALILLLGELFSPLLLKVFGATDRELVFASPYLRIYLIGTVFAMVTTGMNPFINAQGYSRIGMVTVVTGAVANLVLDPLFIFAFGMGVEGAAVATVISQGLSAFLVLRYLRSGKNDFPLTKDKVSLTLTTKAGEKTRETYLPYAGQIVGLGMAPFIMQVTNALVTISANSVLMSIGGASYVSVMTIISSVRQILDTPILAMTDGSSPTISFNYGAKRPDRVRKAMLMMSVMSIGYTVVIWALIELFPGLFVGIFTADTTLAAMALRPLRLYFAAFIFQSLMYCGQTVYKALGKKNRAIFFSLFRKVILVVPLTYVLPYAFGVGTDGVFIAEHASNFIGGSLCFATMLLSVLPELKAMDQKDREGL